MRHQTSRYFSHTQFGTPAPSTEDIMSRIPDPIRNIPAWPARFATVTPAILIVASLLLARPAAGADALNYFQNYFVTGDAAYGSVGLRGTGVNGIATGNITISGIPCTSGVAPAASIVQWTSGPCPSGTTPVDVVAAYLY